MTLRMTVGSLSRHRWPSSGNLARTMPLRRQYRLLVASSLADRVLCLAETHALSDNDSGCWLMEAKKQVAAAGCDATVSDQMPCTTILWQSPRSCFI